MIKFQSVRSCQNVECGTVADGIVYRVNIAGKLY